MGGTYDGEGGREARLVLAESCARVADGDDGKIHLLPIFLQGHDEAGVFGGFLRDFVVVSPTEPDLMR